MTKHFTPTKEQLEKLAKVAKVDVFLAVHSGCLFIVDSENEWEPSLDRNQIAMVIEGLTDEQKKAYNSLMTFVYYGERNNMVYMTTFGQTVHPSISCEKLLEVIG